jgi:predicted nucleic acid-binding protein
MMDSRSRYIVDTNVLIDLHRGLVLKQFFALPYLFISPDVIIDELREPVGSVLTQLGLQSGELSGERVLEVEALSAHHRNIAVNDLFALVLAASKGLTLLTGDNRLRNLAIKHNVHVHGTLWVLDQMVEKNTLKPVEAHRALQKILDHGSRLPLAECQSRLRMWER